MFFYCGLVLSVGMILLNLFLCWVWKNNAKINNNNPNPAPRLEVTKWDGDGPLQLFATPECHL
jgi:hypothetical protein